jgi:hypothetical protein
MPVTPDLLYLPVPHKDTSDVFFPWEQSAPLRTRLDAHAQACPDCTWRTTPIFGASMTSTTVAPLCAEGEDIATALREVATARRAGSR